MLADPPADIQARKVAHGIGPHGEAEFLDDGIDLLRRGALQEQAFRLGAAAGKHAVADEPVAIADHDRDFCQQLAGGDRGGDGLLRGFGAAHDFQQLHDIGGREEMHADDILRPGGGVADGVDIERGGVGGEQGAGFREPVEPAENLFFQLQVFEHRFDDDVGIGDHLPIGGAADEGDAFFHGIGAKRVAVDRDLIGGFDALEALREQFLCRLKDGYGDAGIGEAHGDAAAHGAAADDDGVGDAGGFDAGGRVRHLRRFALAEEDVPLRPALVAGHELHEQRVLGGDALIEGQGEGVADGIDAGGGRFDAGEFFQGRLWRRPRRAPGCFVSRRFCPHGRARG